MGRIKQSVAWWCFVPDKLTPEAVVRAAAEIGYQAFDLVPPEFWQLVRDHGLTIAATSGHQSLTDGLNRLADRPRVERELRASIEQAVKWRIPNLICFSGNRDGLDDATGAEITAETLRRVAKTAEDAGVTLILELLNSKVDHPDYQCDHTDWGVQVCQMVDSPRVRLLYDIYHMQVMEGDVIRTIQARYPYIAHYHTAGNPGRHEIDASQELNYPSIMHAIAETGFDGYVAQEFIPLGEPVVALRSAFDLCSVT